MPENRGGAAYFRIAGSPHGMPGGALAPSTSARQR
jgi:hypothetical protein